MRKVLLVDDEQLIIKGLTVILERSGTSFTDITGCTSSRAALELISGESFDLVILDIEMPQMNGLAFMKEVQALGRKPKFIIISGYSKFDYAAESLKYGAKAYLLKPVAKPQLVEALNEVEKELAEEESVSFSQQKAAELINRLRINELNYILMNNNLDPAEMGNLIKDLELKIFEGGFYMSVLYRYDRDTGRNPSYGDISEKANLDFYFQENSCECVKFIGPENAIVLVTQSQEVLSPLPGYLFDKTGMEFFLASSSRCDGIMEIRKAYLQAWEAMKYRIVSEPGRILFFNEIQDAGKTAPALPLEAIKKVTRLIGTQRIKELEDTLLEIFNPDTIEKMSIRYIESLTEEIYQSIIRPLAEGGKEDGQNALYSGKSFADIHGFRNVRHYFIALRNYIMDISSSLFTVYESSKGKNEMYRVVQYIDSNYFNDLNMAMLANHFSINYTYFSYLFKNHTSLSFSDYLKKVRVEKAKELLRNDDLKIYEIAEMVGFKHPKYFTKTFRGITGISPQEYKTKLL